MGQCVSNKQQYNQMPAGHAEFVPYRILLHHGFFISTTTAAANSNNNNDFTP
jgi:hypothetical protein